MASFLAALGCGTTEVTPGPADAAPEVVPEPDGDVFPDVSATDGETPLTSCPAFTIRSSHFVELPPAGVATDLSQLCAASETPVESSGAARVSLGTYSPITRIAQGYIAVPEPIHLAATTFPTVTVSSPSLPALATAQIKSLSGVVGGYTFSIYWPDALPIFGGATKMALKVTIPIACGDGGTRTIEATTWLEKCDEPALHTWRASGDYCTICLIVQDMPVPFPWSSSAGR
jgi:hypothetical protein